MKEMEAVALRTRTMISLHDSATLKEAAKLLSDASIGALGVLDDAREVIGIFTERDLAWAIGDGKDPRTTTLGDVANRLPIIIPGPITLDEAIEKMMAAHVRHLIIDENGYYCIVSMRDVFSALLGGPEPGKTSIRWLPVSLAEMRRWLGTASL